MNVARNFASVLAEAGGPDGHVLDAVTAVALLAVGLIVFLAAHASLRRMALFRGRTRTLVAACTTALSVIALMHGAPRSGELASDGGAGRVPRPEVEGILLGYSALGLTLLLLLLLLLILRLSRRLTGRRAGLRGAGIRASEIRSNEQKASDRDGTCGRARTDRLARINRAPGDRLPGIAEKTRR